MILRLLTSMHGHAGFFLAAMLAHPAWFLRRGASLSRGRRVFLWGIALSSIAIYGSGLALYGPYRANVKRRLFFTDSAAGWLFETKEHLALVVLLLALAGSAAALSASKGRGNVRQSAGLLLAWAALLTFLTSLLGMWISAVATFE